MHLSCVSELKSRCVEWIYLHFYYLNYTRLWNFMLFYNCNSTEKKFNYDQQIKRSRTILELDLLIQLSMVCVFRVPCLNFYFKMMEKWRAQRWEKLELANYHLQNMFQKMSIRQPSFGGNDSGRKLISIWDLSSLPRNCCQLLLVPRWVSIIEAILASLNPAHVFRFITQLTNFA